MKYTDQFTPAMLEFDMSYDGLPIGDRGCIMEHLAPHVESIDTWYWCHSQKAVNERIDTIEKAIKKASQIGA